ncbi:hypothetical protein BOX15_Mlig028910g2 [Macrostomum lignano]|uniref:Uncharacterized protein n=1 Tax=Macrostomum lignano TaxID=282301 RepID=A0A267GLX8_9PLAT|nr:hypothetical protein BOX15_Mlig028910g2 [Macrostomum lignano]
MLTRREYLLYPTSMQSLVSSSGGGGGGASNPGLRIAESPRHGREQDAEEFENDSVYCI